MKIYLTLKHVLIREKLFFANYFKTCFLWGGKETMSKCKFTVKVFITVTSDGKAPTILLNGLQSAS
jgi:hypothetical protein